MAEENQPLIGICDCEQAAHSELGSVSNGEDLARVIMSPSHFNKNGELKPGAFPLSHISKSGLSLLRIDKMLRPDIIRIADAIAPTGQTCHSLAIASAYDIRAIELPPGAQALCVVDDPVENDPHAPDNPAHAIAISSVDRTAEESEPDVLEIQTELLQLFKKTLRRVPDEV